MNIMGPRHELPGHFSHSSRDAFLRCARAYFLKKVAGAPSRPALWLVGGSAVHHATEVWDRWHLAGEPEPFHVDQVWHGCFAEELDEARGVELNERAWRQSRTEPIEVWRVLGPQYVQAWIDWRRRSPWDIWVTPDGEPAIELDVSGHLPGCDVEIKAYVDRVFYDPVLERYAIVDLKTGRRPPKDASQFATYKALIQEKFAIEADIGAAFMNRTGALHTPWRLTEFTPESVGAIYQEAWEGVQRGDFPANGYDRECFLCDVGDACTLNNGRMAAWYDPAHPDYVPF